MGEQGAQTAAELLAEFERTLRQDGVPEGSWPETVRALAGLVQAQERELASSRLELQRTNAGLLALHAEMDRQRRHNAFLDDVSRASATSLNAVEMLGTVARLLSDRRFADVIRVWTVSDTGLFCPAEPAGAPDPTTEAAHRTRELAQDGDRRLSVPLAAGPHVLGVLDLHRADADFGSAEVALARGIADRAAVGLRNAIMYEREHDFAERLQHAMLPDLAPLQGLDVAARYRSATRGIHVGGDWYDAVARSDGTVVLSVGDVTGHGVDAAVVMGKLQNTLHAYAIEGHGPATSLRLVHELLRDWTTSLFATAVVVELDTTTGVLRWASAGHVPPLLEDADGTLSYLDAEHAPLLGIGLQNEIPEHKRQLAPGSSIVLYTDGLIERRSSDMDAGLERLAGVLSATCGDAEPRAEQVLQAMLGGAAHDDDVCLLLCRWSPGT